MTPTVDEIERRYAELVRRFEAGEIDEATFEAETERFQFQDEEGRIWALGARTGRWYAYTDHGWVLADPPREARPQEAETPPAPQPVPFSKYWLGLLIAAGAVLACLFLGAVGLALWREVTYVPPTLPPVVATKPPPVSVLTPAGGLVWVTATPRPPTVAPMQSPTPAPTSTPTSTETPMPPPTPSATATLAAPPTPTTTWTPSPSPTQTATQRPRHTATSTPTRTHTPTSTPSSTVTPTRPPAATTTSTRSVSPAGAPTATSTPTRRPPSPTPTDTPRPKLTGRILYPVYTEISAWYDIYLQPVDSSDRQWLVGEASQPALSPDGQWLAFRSWQANDRGLRVISLDGGQRRRVTDRLEDGLPAWSPDGGTLLFSSRRENDRIDRIYTVSPYGGAVQTLSRDYAPVYGLMPAWLPDGRIVYKATHGASGLYLINPDGSGTAQLLEDASATAPAVSPDGQAIVFMSQRDGNWEIYGIGTDGSGLRRLTDHPAQDGLPAWSPDGQWIAFVSDREGEWAMWAMDRQGKNVQRLFALQGAPGGHVRGEPEFSSRGWTEEQIQWLP
ncbi:MAG: TolB family protein [Anaerolineae bacterium]